MFRFLLATIYEAGSVQRLPAFFLLTLKFLQRRAMRFGKACLVAVALGGILGGVKGKFRGHIVHRLIRRGDAVVVAALARSLRQSGIRKQPRELLPLQTT